jgi:hypothetical protein
MIMHTLVLEYRRPFIVTFVSWLLSPGQEQPSWPPLLR